MSKYDKELDTRTDAGSETLPGSAGEDAGAPQRP
jgi:hypothetical protein